MQKCFPRNFFEKLSTVQIPDRAHCITRILFIQMNCNYFDSIIIGYFECLNENINAQHNIDNPNGVSTQCDSHHDASNCFSRNNKVLRLICSTIIIDLNVVCFMLKKKKKQFKLQKMLM